MKFTYTHITKNGAKSTEYKIDNNNKITTKVKFNHDKFAEFDEWFAKLEEKYNEEQENKYY